MPEVTLRHFIVSNLPLLPLDVICQQLGKKALYDGDYADMETMVELDKTGRPLALISAGVRMPLVKLDVHKAINNLRDSMSQEFPEVTVPEPAEQPVKE